MKKLMILLLAMSLSGFAQDIPDSPRPKFLNTTDKITVGLFAGAVTTDALSTQKLIGARCRCLGETNPLARPFVGSRNGQAFISGVGFGGTLGLMYLAHKTGHEHIKRIIPIAAFAAETAITFHNYSLINRWGNSPPR